LSLSGQKGELKLALHQRRRILDTLNTAHFADYYPGQFKETLGFSSGDGIPTPEHQVHIGDAGNSANLGQSTGFKTGDQFDEKIALYHMSILYSLSARLASCKSFDNHLV
jgi:hypothetical protein